MHEDSSKKKIKMMKFCGFEEKLKLEEEEDDETVRVFSWFNATVYGFMKIER